MLFPKEKERTKNKYAIQRKCFSEEFIINNNPLCCRYKPVIQPMQNIKGQWTVRNNCIKKRDYSEEFIEEPALPY